MGDSPQNNSQSNQNFAPDISEMYKAFVTGGATPKDKEAGTNIAIDDLRGLISVSVTGGTTKDLIAALNIDPKSNTIAGTPNNSTPVQLAQESRCHTFYRIIGFPIVTSDKSRFYNPGLDIIKDIDSPRLLTLDEKLSIASNVGKDFEKLSQKRETYSNNTSQVFNVPQSVEAGVLSLMSGTSGGSSNNAINKRSFVLPLDKFEDPFDFNVDHQTYPISISSTYCLVEDHPIKLSEFQDSNGTKPNLDITNPSIFKSHLHIIKPFMVDPRIDFSIWSADSKTSPGLCKRVAVPFVPDASYLQASSVSTAERPLLEKIITDRFDQSNNIENAGASIQNVTDYIENLKTIQSENIGNTNIKEIFSNDIFKLKETPAFSQYLSIIQGMMSALVSSIRIIQAAQAKYYWLPIPSIKGPENGCTIRPVAFNKNVSPDLITTADFNIVYNKTQSLMSNVNSAVAQANTTPDAGGFAFNAFFNHKMTFNPSTTDAQGDISSKTGSTINSKRNRVLSKAGDALQIVEMIMGEYSGLGLCDIIAVVASLSVMPLKDLLGLLDKDAIIRAEKVLGQSLSSQQEKDISVAMTSLAKTVKGFYLIMDQIFEDYQNNKALNH
jgi:hypothetical protein